MLKNDSLTAAAFVLSLLAIVFSVANFNFSPSTDTFVGIMAGLIGVCATIMVGFQIFNSIDTKNKLEEIKDCQTILTKKIEEIDITKNKFEAEVEYNISITKALSLHVSQPITSFLILFISLHKALQINDASLVKQTMELIKTAHESVLECNKMPTDKECIEMINGLFTDIFDKYELFQFIKDELSSIIISVQGKMQELAINHE